MFLFRQFSGPVLSSQCQWAYFLLEAQQLQLPATVRSEPSQHNYTSSLLRSFTFAGKDKSITTRNWGQSSSATFSCRFTVLSLAVRTIHCFRMHKMCGSTTFHIRKHKICSLYRVTRRELAAKQLQPVQPTHTTIA